MKIKGYKPDSVNTETIVIPRGNDKDLVFIVQAVLDTEPFDKLCPAPEPPTIVRKGGATSVDTEDPKFLEKLKTWVSYKNSWIILEAFKATPDLEWETVDRLNPETWANYLQELKDFKLSDFEIKHIIERILSVNGLDEDKLEAARKRFLASVEATQKPS